MLDQINRREKEGVLYKKFVLEVKRTLQVTFVDVGFHLKNTMFYQCELFEKHTHTHTHRLLLKR